MTTLSTLRPATMADVPRMEALIRLSGVQLSAGFYTPEQAQAITRHVFGVDTQLVEDGTYFIVERGAEAVACGGWSKRATLFGADHTKTGPDPLLDPAHDAARIRAFFVAPSAARQGLGTMMMTHCQQAAQAAGFRVLELAATMPGVPLYLASGFDVTEPFDVALPGGISVALARMRKHLV